MQRRVPKTVGHPDQHSALLTQIAELDYAASALQDNTVILKDIDKDLASRKKKLEGVCAKTSVHSLTGRLCRADS